MNYYVLMKERAGTDHGAEPHRVCKTPEEVDGVIARIEKANPYEMKETGTRSWELGPDHDAGFFGHNKMRFWAVEVKGE